jgi:hypothetical protein
MNWIKLTDRLPAAGKLVYVRDATGYVTAFTFYGREGFGMWNTKLSDPRSHDNGNIVEWLDE